MKNVSWLVIGLVAAWVSLSGPVFGTIITLEGTTTGTFLPGLSGMTFVGQNFSWTTDLAGNATVILGTLTNSKANITHVNDAFSLGVTFDEPTGTPASKIFTADVWASWNGFNGFCDVWFDEVNPTHFTYTTAGGTGSFDLGIAGTLSNGYSWESFAPHRWFGVGSNGSVQVMGKITNATFTPVPEPVSMTILALGGFVLLRRLKS